MACCLAAPINYVNFWWFIIGEVLLHLVGNAQDVYPWYEFQNYSFNMMVSSNGNIFRVTFLLCGEFTCHRHKGQWRGAFVFSLICAWTMVEYTIERRWFETPSRPLWRHCNEDYDPHNYRPVLTRRSHTSTEQNGNCGLGPTNGIQSTTCVVAIIRQRKIVNGEHRPLSVVFHTVKRTWGRQWEKMAAFSKWTFSNSFSFCERIRKIHI